VEKSRNYNLLVLYNCSSNKCQRSTKTVLKYPETFLAVCFPAENLNQFYFGVLHPVARALSRLLQEPSLATTC
jgi:hypothetical protein